jgi:HD-like signal output (HDOD) protein
MGNMKKKICFAGFAQDELESLKQAMSGIAGTWDCTFVADAPAALEAMAANPIDAVVANMRMEGMHGAELLHRAGELHPTALRFVVGDMADQELIINCIGGTHQFIARPYKPAELISVVQRSFALDACLSSDQLRALAPRLRRLPCLPSTYFEVLKRVESRDANADSVGEVIARDPSATARVLQMVNSAAFALAQKVSDPSHAVLLLGLDTVKSLVLCLQVFSRGEQSKHAGFSLGDLWEHSSQVAKMAREIVLHETSDTRLANDAFTAGLLHDVGRIVIASNLPKEYAAIVAAAKQKSCPLHEEELAQLGVTHAQVGAYLLGLWGMTASLVEAAALHHVPRESSTQEFSILTAVHVANVFAYEGSKHEDGLPLPELDQVYLEALDLAHKPAIWRKAISGHASTGDTERVKRPAPQTTAKPTPAPDTHPAAKPAAKPALAPVAHSATKPGAKSAGVTAKVSKPNWLLRILAPASAVAVLALAVGWWNDWSFFDGSMPVHAKSPAQSAPTTAASVPAPVPVETVTEARSKDIAAPPAALAAQAVPEAAPANQDVTTNPGVLAAAPSNPFDSVRVQGIFYSTEHSSVIINGKLLNPGDRLGAIQVVSIGSSNVLLSCKGERRVFKMK